MKDFSDFLLSMDPNVPNAILRAIVDDPKNVTDGDPLVMASVFTVRLLEAYHNWIHDPKA